MSFATVFSLSSSTAMLGWLLLICLPRWPWLIAALRFGVIGALSLVYAILIFVYFFRIADAGFGSIGEVRALFLNDGGLVAGWVHYLAFDLFIGTWIAVEADKRGWNRLLQIPILIGTFMFGPVGLLLFHLTRSTELALSSRRS